MPLLTVKVLSLLSISVMKFIKSGFEGIEKPEGKILMSELVGEAFCKELARRGMEEGRYIKVPTPEGGIEAFNIAVNESQRKYLHQIQEIILAWKF